jgi:hypothetical protein
MAETIYSELKKNTTNNDDPSIEDWYKEYVSKDFVYKYVIKDKDEIDFLYSKMGGLDQEKLKVIFDNPAGLPLTAEGVLGSVLGSYAALLAFPLTLAAAQADFIWNFSGTNFIGGVLRHLELLEENGEDIPLRHAELFLKLYVGSGYSKNEDLVHKIMLYISKIHPDLTFNGSIVLGKDFGWETFNLIATEMVNEYLDTNPDVPEITGGIIIQPEEIGKDYYYPYNFVSVIKDYGLTGITAAGISTATGAVVGAAANLVGGASADAAVSTLVTMILESAGIDDYILKDVKISKSFKDTLDPLFFKKKVNYTFPFKDALENNLENLRNTIRLEGPLSTAKLSGGFTQFEDLARIFGDFLSRAGYIGIVERTYVNSFLKPALIELQADPEKLSFYQGPSWRTKFDNALATLANEVQEQFAIEILNALRWDTWKNLAKELRGIEDPKATDINKLLPAAFAKAQKDFDATHPSLVGDATERALTEAEIEGRQKFIKQCALMSNFSKMKKMNRELISSKLGIHKPTPYKNRFYLLDDTRQRSSIPNKLLVPTADKIQPMLDITPDIHAFLIPKIRLFKVFNRESDGKLDQFEFLFSNFVNPSRVNNFGETFDKGDGAGIKSFSFSFEGTNPAVSRNDITAKLSLFFQSFNDFIRKRRFPGNKKDYAYVDLLLLPAGKSKTGYDTGSPLQSDPSYYRIRADVGWMVDTTKNQGLIDVLENRKMDYEKFKTALRTINKSFYLNMIDHELNINDDGTVVINADFRAYMESAMKSSTLDILSTPQIKKERKKLQDKYLKIVKDNTCSDEDLNKIKITFNQISESLIKRSYQSIIDRMVCNGTIYYLVADPTAMNEFATLGFLSKAVPLSTPSNVDQGTSSNTTQIMVQAAEKQGEDQTGSYTLDRAFKDIPLSPNEQWTTINFFFLGDLLYTLLDCAYKEDGITYDVGAENLKLLLSSFDYDDLYDKTKTPQFANIADIPISAEYFFEWYTENVIKKERKNYPLMIFIRDICNHLISNILLENCFKVSYDKTMRFQTGNFLSNSQLGDVFAQIPEKFRPDGIYNVGDLYKANILPLENESEGASVSMADYYNYIFLYAVSPATSHTGTGVKTADGKVGIYHYQLGANKGLMKKIKFAKTDIQYLREARFFRNGHDGLMQLGNVYKVTMEMIGNTIYYPGMQFYVDPKGIGKGPEFDPTIGPEKDRRASIANSLGLGGYHLVTRVNSELASGKFTTSVEGMFVYSGDGNPAKITNGQSKVLSDITDKVSQKATIGCPGKVDDAIKLYMNSQANGSTSIYGSIEDKGKTIPPVANNAKEITKVLVDAGLSSTVPGVASTSPAAANSNPFGPISDVGESTEMSDADKARVQMGLKPLGY